MNRACWSLLIASSFFAAGCGREPAQPQQGAVAPPAQSLAPTGQPPVAASEPGGAPSTVGRQGAETARAGQPAAPAPPTSRTLTLEEGTAVRVRIDSTLSTKTNKPGDSFTGSLVEPLVDGDRVVAAKGARVEGTVAESDPGGRVKGVAQIAVRLTTIHTSSGEAIEVSTNSAGRQAAATKKKDATKIAIGSGVGAAIGAIAGGGKGAAIGAAAGGGAGTGVVLATHGDSVTIPSETVLTFKLRQAVSVKVKN